MTILLPRLQSLLMDLLSPIRPVAPEAIKALDTEDWSCLLKMIRQHRLGPLLHWQIARVRDDLPIPDAVADELQQSFKRAAMRALVWQRELVRVHRILDRAAIPHAALKGAYLAFHAYPHPALRPLRDLDILVPENRAPEAFQALIDGGLSRNDDYPGSPAAYLQHSKHFPPLRSPAQQISVELHNRLFHPEHNGQAQVDLSATPMFWQRCIQNYVANETVPFVSPTDLLLHLIVHAVFDHQFNNGPLLLSDIAFLLENQEIDWPLFWAMAEQGQHKRGCLLALKLMERYWGMKSIGWPGGVARDTASMEAQLDIAALLMLRDFEIRSDVTLAKEVAHHPSLIGKFGALLRKIFVPKMQIAASYPVSKNSALIYFWYPVRWWRLATKRLPEFLRARQQVHVITEVRQLTELDRWLANTGQ